MVLVAVSESNSASYVSRHEQRNGIFHDLSEVHWAMTREKNHACYSNIMGIKYVMFLVTWPERCSFSFVLIQGDLCE
jgi:hypothetical protein